MNLFLSLIRPILRPLCAKCKQAPAIDDEGYILCAKCLGI